MAGVNPFIEEDIKYLLKSYPGLSIVKIATVPTLVGTVTLPEILKLGAETATKYSIRLKIVYPEFFPVETIQVYDMDVVIDWDKIPYEHQHKFIDGRLCTHHFYEIETLPFYNRSWVIVHNAIRLYLAYLNYQVDGIWILDDLAHGRNGTLRVIQDMKKWGY